MTRVAIVGAGGFVGSRLVESMVLSGTVDARCVVRGPRNLATLCRFGRDVDVRIGDAVEPDSLRDVLEGCSMVVNLVTGPPASIRSSTRSLHQVSRELGVERLVHLSSAVVFGDRSTPIVGDAPPAGAKLWMPYAKAKLESELYLESVMLDGSLQIVVLRPGLVWGPASPLTAGMMDSLRRKDAYLVGNGGGVFNGIYIDNLVHRIRAVLEHQGDARGFFNVIDDEEVTWRAALSQLAVHLQFDMAEITAVSARRPPRSVLSILDFLQSSSLTSPLYFWLKDNAPAGVKGAIKSFFEGRSGHYCYDTVASDYVRQPAVSREMWSLQRVGYRLSDQAFRQHFGTANIVSFDEGTRRALSWARCVGYPIES